MIEIIHLKCGIWNIHCSFRNLNSVSLFYPTSRQTSTQIPGSFDFICTRFLSFICVGYKCFIIYNFSPPKTGITAFKHPVGQPILKKLNSGPH